MATLKNTTISDTGFLTLPVGTTAQRPSAANGMFRHNSNNASVETYLTSSWKMPGYPYRYYFEGIDANRFTANWNNSTTTYMTQFGGFGPGTGHGYTASTTYTLTLTGVPFHNTIRYRVKWHFVDSPDNETNYLILMNSAGVDATFAQFRKTSPTGDVAFDSVASGTTATWFSAGSTAKSGYLYSYKPWGGTSLDGYVQFDTGYYAHTSSTFYAKHQIGLDQAIADEAVYITHVEVWLGL